MLSNENDVISKNFCLQMNQYSYTRDKREEKNTFDVDRQHEFYEDKSYAMIYCVLIYLPKRNKTTTTAAASAAERKFGINVQRCNR